MAFDVMDVFVKIGADTSGLESGIEKSKGLASGLGNAVSGGLKMAGAAIGAATTAVTAFAASSVKVGSTFDSSMSQVAATMGKTVDEIGELRQFAQDMGATTAFSATQAADALNYMALAGYSADESMQMLPNVLNLAAAGDMELARASDMVTDAQSALGLEMSEMTGFVDQMAKTASQSNTSVAQLGDAILTVGGTAKTLSGGTTELNTALGILADNGIKGAEGGTKLRNVILSLSAPTDKAAQMLEGLGVNAVDAEGNLRPLDDIMGELSKSLDGLGTAERAEVINTIFNKQDIAAVNALLDTSAERWDELSGAIDDSAGAADKMAKTQLDNLAGDVTLFKSALEGAQILISDKLTPSLRDFVKFGTDGITKISEGFKSGGLTGAMEAFGQVLSDGLNMIIDKIPAFIDAGMKLLGALGQGILDNLPTILDAATQILTQLGQGIITALPKLLEGAIQIVKQLGAYLIENIPTIIPAIVELINQMVLMLVENAPALVEGAVALVTGLATALVENIPTLLPAIVQLITQIAIALIENLPVLVQAVIDINIALVQAIIKNLPVYIEAVVQILVAIGQLFVQYGSQFLSIVVQNLEELVTNVGNGMRDMFNTVIEWLSQLPSKMAYYAGYAVGSFIKFVQELPSKVTEIFNNVMSKVASFGTNLANKSTEMARNFFNNLVNGIASLPSRMAQFGSELVNAIANLPSRFAEIGSNIVQGIWNGISNGWSWLVNSVSELANSLLQGAKDALGIASPSKEFAYVGRMVDEGFAKGLTDYSHLIDNAIDDVIRVPEVNNILGASLTGAGGDNMGYTQILNITSPVALTPSEVARQARNATRDMVLAMSM